MEIFPLFHCALFSAWILRDCGTIVHSLIEYCVSNLFFVTLRSPSHEEDLDSPEKDLDIQDLKEQVNNLSSLLKELHLQKEKLNYNDKKQVWAVDIKLELY